MIEATSNADVQYVLDANMFIVPAPDALWDALLAREARLVLSSMVYGELKYWLLTLRQRFAHREEYAYLPA